MAGYKRLSRQLALGESEKRECGLDFKDIVTALASPPNCVGRADGPYEHHLNEGAGMVAYGKHVRVHPEREHGKQFDFAGWPERQGFAKVSSIGSTSYGGVYRDAAGHTITVNPKSGVGDAVAEVANGIISAECKGGITNTRHPRQASRLHKGCARRSVC